jgi:hypothetical protein
MEFNVFILSSTKRNKKNPTTWNHRSGNPKIKYKLGY